MFLRTQNQRNLMTLSSRRLRLCTLLTVNWFERSFYIRMFKEFQKYQTCIVNWFWVYLYCRLILCTTIL